MLGTYDVVMFECGMYGKNNLYECVYTVFKLTSVSYIYFFLKCSQNFEFNLKIWNNWMKSNRKCEEFISKHEIL